MSSGAPHDAYSPSASLTILRNANDSGNIFTIGNTSVASVYNFWRDRTDGHLGIQGTQAGFNNIALVPTSGQVSIGPVGNLNSSANMLWVQGSISASAITASLSGTATTASFATTSSFVLGSVTSASYALSASWCGPKSKAGHVSSSNFGNTAGQYYTASVKFNSPMPDANYAINLTLNSKDGQWLPLVVTGSILAGGFTCSLEISSGVVNADVMWSVHEYYDV